MEPVPGAVQSGAAGGAAETARRPNAARLEHAAQEFEAVFLGMLFKSMRATSGGGLLEGEQDSQTYREMFDQELARRVAGAGGVGLARMILADQARREAAARPAELPGGGQAARPGDGIEK